MNRRGTKFDELSVGDVIRQRKSGARYQVSFFNDPGGGLVEVYLQPLDRDAPLMMRHMHQLVKNWRRV